MFGVELDKQLDNWINIEVPAESISLITKQQPKDIDSKSLRIRLTGSLIEGERNQGGKYEDIVPKESSEEDKNRKENKNPQIFDIRVDGPDFNDPDEEVKVKIDDQNEEKVREIDNNEDRYKYPPNITAGLQKTRSPVSKSPQAKEAELKSPRSPSNSLEASENKLSKPQSKTKSPQPKSPQNLNDKIKSPQSKSPKASEESKNLQVAQDTKLFKPKSPKESTSSNALSQPKSPRSETIEKNPEIKSPRVADKKSSIEEEKKLLEERLLIEKSLQNELSQENPSLKNFTEDITAEVDKENILNNSISFNSSELNSDDEKAKQEDEKMQVEATRQRPKNINIKADSINSPCGYLNGVTRTEWHIRSVMATLSKLKEDMGGSFLKLLEESTRRDSRSPTRSPSRKLTNSGLRTPLVSQRSLNSSVLSSFRVEEDNILDIPGNADVFLDRISVKNLDILVPCAVGLLAKIAYGNSQSREIDPIKIAINSQEKSKSMIIDSMKATQVEFTQEKDNFDVMIKRLKDEISNISQNLESTKKKNELLRYEKNSHQQTLKKLKAEKEEIKKKYNANTDIDGIKQLRKTNETLEKNRVDIEEKLSLNAAQFKGQFDSLTITQAKFIEQKTTLLNEIKAITSIIDNIEKENFKIRSEMQGLNGFNYVDDELRKMLLSYQTNSTMHSQSLDSIRTQLTYLRSHKEDQANQAYILHQKIEADTKKVKNSQSSWNKEIEINSNQINELNKDYKKLKQEVAYIEEVYNKKNNIDNIFETIFTKSKTNQETKDQLIGELFYFSDFVFSSSQTFLQQKRIYQRVKSIVDEKEIEIEAMRSAVHEIKHNNPVYFPVPEDIIDQAIADYFNSRDDVLIVPFVRESYGVYYYGSKKIMISVERGKLIVKVGGGFLPIEVFIDNYTDIEINKYGGKTIENSPKMKKVMAKWVGGLDSKAESPEKLREGLVKAMMGHKFISAYGIKDHKVLPQKQCEDFATPPRADTPVIEEDI